MILQSIPQTDTITTPSRPGGPTAPATSSTAAPGPRISTYLKNSTQGEVEAYNDGTSTPLQLLLNPLGGNVGIGTTTPGQKLSVAGTIESTTGGFKFPDATTQTTAGISLTTADGRYLKLSGGTLTGAVTAASFIGSGAGLTNLSAASLTGTIAPADLPGSTIGPSLPQVATLNWAPQNSTPQTFPVGNTPEGVAFDGSNIWVTNKGDNTVMKVRSSDGMVLGSYSVGTQPYGVTFDGTNMWVANFASANVTKLRASDGTVLGTYNVGTNPIRICFDGTNLWVTNYGSAKVTKLSTSGTVIGTYTVGTQPYGIVFDGTNIWVANNGSSSVTVLKASDGSLVNTYSVLANPEDMAFDGVNVWVTSYGSIDVTKLRASDGAILGYPAVGVQTSGIAFDGSNIWVASFSNGAVFKLRASDGALLSTFGTPANPNSVAFDGGNIWTADYGAASVTKIPGAGTINSLSQLSAGDFSSLLKADNTFVGDETVSGTLATTTTGSGTAVYGSADSGDGVVGYSATGTGVYGESGSSYGVYGISNGNIAGVYGTSGGLGVEGTSSTGTGVYGESNSSYGMYGTSAQSTGVIGYGTIGVEGASNSVGVEGFNLSAVSGNRAYLSSNCCAADLYGTVDVHGTLTKTAGSFKIDDPIDPANKYLSHSFVESPDMKNIYDGIVTTDGSGIADVTLPDWFMALNKDFRYQLTVIGVFAQAIVEQEVTDNHFRIRTNQPNVKVSWQVTGIRHDPYADAHRIPIEEDKPAAEKGTYLFPELYGQPAEKSLHALRYPQKENPATITAKPVVRPTINTVVSAK
jgi:hypothetical protein